MILQGQMLAAADTSYLDRLLLDEEGRIRLLPFARYSAIPRGHLRLWMHRKARYTLPTVELITWLQWEIGDRKAIEVGCGNGDIYWHLGIKGTDSSIQTGPLSQWYRATGQVPTKPRHDVEIIEAEGAVKKYKPQVVVASYLTRRFVTQGDNPDVEGEAQAFAFGAREEQIVRGCETYIHIGNRNTHGEKRILKWEHGEIAPGWLVTRGEPAQDVIYIWRNQK